MGPRVFCRLAIIAAALLLSIPAQSLADEDSSNLDPNGAFLEKLARDYTLPTYYGEMLDFLTKKAGGQFETAAQFYVRGKTADAGKNLAQLAYSKWAREWIGEFAYYSGVGMDSIDVAIKLKNGEKAAAIESGIIAALKAAAGSSSGDAFLRGLGVTPPVFSALVFSYQVYRESEKAARSETEGRLLQSLYGGVEIMTRSRGRRASAPATLVPAIGLDFRWFKGCHISNPDD